MIDMTFENHAGEGLDYLPCRYGTSKLLFRGPRKKLERDFVAVIGGTETYGRFVATPYSERLEAATGIQCVNLGCVNAGLDVFVSDSAIAETCAAARLTVLQVTGAQNLSNRFYSVHPRRNDRFLKASSLLQTIFRDVDFTEFNFTRHMLTTLRAASPEKFTLVEDELRAAWVARMLHLLRRLSGRVVLLWLAEREPDEPAGIPGGEDPLYVDRAMLDLVVGETLGLVEVVTRGFPRDGMVLSEFEAALAAGLPGPAAHDAAALALAELVRENV